jgi:hypothetical protein
MGRDDNVGLPKAPPAIWRAFAAQAAWKSWVIVGLLGIIGLQAIATIRLATQPPEYVLVDGSTGDATLVKHSLSTDALLRFIAEKTKPPKLAIVRFTKDFLHLALAVNSSTIEANWPAALRLMSPALRAKLEGEATAQKLIETYKVAQRKTDLQVESLELVDRTDTLLAVRAVLKRRIAPLLDSMGGSVVQDRIQVDVVEEIVPPGVDHPDGLQVVEWRMAKLEPALGAAGEVGARAPDAPIGGGSRAP